MTRFAIYARYSTDLQSEHSIPDQVRLCRERAEQDGGAVARVFTDAAISGAHDTNRPGLQELMAAARDGRFDAVVTEALDRLSRDQEHMAGIFKRLKYAGVRIITLSEGEVDSLHVGIMGTMNALALEELGRKTRRGLTGVARDGRIPGGISYGHRKVFRTGADGEPVNGLREIDPAGADIVRRIFREYAAGASPRAIAADLNRDGVASPKGGAWNASTINGNRARGNGILHNRLYIGEIAFNRQKFRKDPETGKRIGSVNDKADWLEAKVPHLRIIDDAAWAAAQERKGEFAGLAVNKRRRAKHLFSGLLTCGSCGGSMTIIHRDKYGCGMRRERGTCDNKRTIPREEVERRVLEGLKKRLFDPEAVAAFVDEYHAEMKRLRKQAGREQAEAARRQKDVAAKITRIITAIEEGTDTAGMRERLEGLESEGDGLREALEGLDGSNVIEVHPNAAGLYKKRVAALSECLNRKDAKAEASEILRGLINKIILSPGKKPGEYGIEIYGELAAALNLAAARDGGKAECRLMMVAGVGFEPTTFRL